MPKKQIEEEKQEESLSQAEKEEKIEFFGDCGGSQSVIQNTYNQLEPGKRAQREDNNSILNLISDDEDR